MHQYITSIPLASSSSSSPTALCHLSPLMSLLSSLIALPSLHSDSHTLTIIPHCFFLSHLFPWLWVFTAPRWARFLFRVGRTPLKLRRSSIYMMRSTRDSPRGTAMLASLRCLGSSHRTIWPITWSHFQP